MSEKKIKEYSIENLNSNEYIDSKFINKKSKCRYIPKDIFEEYQAENNVRIIGNISINGKRNKMPKTSDDSKLERIVKLPLSDEYIKKHPKKQDDPYYYYKMYKSDSKNTVGYACVGSNRFVRITKSKLVYVLFVLFIIMVLTLVAVLCHHTVEENKPTFSLAKQESEMTTQRGEVTTDINAVYNAFPPKMRLTKKKPYIYLYNDIENTGAYNFTYSVYVDGKCVYKTDDPKTKDIELITPGNYVAYDMWSEFDKGSYEVIVKSVPYTVKNNEKRPSSPELKTKVEIVK